MATLQAYREIKRHPTQRELLKLAVVFVLGFGALGAIQRFVQHHETAAIVLWSIAAGLAIVSLLPGIGRFVYIGWMGLGITIGFFTQPIFLFVTYAVIFVPLGFVFRLAARDTMKRKREPDAKTYWEDYEESDETSSYFKQY